MFGKEQHTTNIIIKCLSCVTSHLPSPSISIATAFGNRLVSWAHRCWLLTSSGPLRNTPSRTTDGTNSPGFFRGASQPSSTLLMRSARCFFGGTLWPSSSIPLSVCLVGAYVVSYAETTTSPSLAFSRFRLAQEPTLITALGLKTRTEFWTATVAPSGPIAPALHFIKEIFSFVASSSPISQKYKIRCHRDNS